MTAPGPIDLTGELSRRSTIHMNVGQEMVVTTVDKLRLCLIENRDSLADKKEWVTPLSLFVTFVATLAATDFHDFLLKASVWNAIYVIGAGSSLIWLVRALFKAWNNRNLGSIDTIIARIKPVPTTVSPELQKWLWSLDLAKKVGEALGKSPLPTTTATPVKPPLEPGNRVRHATYGEGTVQSVGTETTGEKYAVVEFGSLLTIPKRVPWSSLTRLN
jgi:hypothetical protein